jgi:hypothetical protein
VVYLHAAIFQVAGCWMGGFDNDNEKIDTEMRSEIGPQYRIRRSDEARGLRVAWKPS